MLELLFIESFVVAPLVGAWIEIIAKLYKYVPIVVAPLVGAWIEILTKELLPLLVVVAPLVGAWIEISESIDLTRSRYWSLPSWERGLKFPIKWDIFVDIPVAPLVGAWIEI